MRLRLHHALLALILLFAAGALWAVAPAFSPDPPSGSGIETILMVLVGSVLGPLVTALLKKAPWIDEDLGAAVNLGVVVVAYVLAWWLWTDADKAQLEQFLLAALAAAGVGGAANNVWRKKLAPRIP